LKDRSAFGWVREHARLTLREFFELFLESADINVSTFLQLVPRQKSRPYTISSSYREDPKKIGICVSMVYEELPSMSSVLEELAEKQILVPGAGACRARYGENAVRSRPFRGICSEMLCARCEVGDKLQIFARSSTFRLPRKASTPVIMVGAGTGMAPFRAFVREFIAEGGIRPKTMLFFGCRKRDEDFIYRDELEEAVSGERPVLSELVTAFSREQQEKVYVQHRLRERGEDIARLLQEGGFVFVCGAKSMGEAIRGELGEVLGSTAQVSTLLSQGRIVEELW